ncbi:O-antigen polymerase [Selenomonas ruminantium]|uniref:O-antigen polymerase n=1 Tax=Selenomonas ruminantium TaxID=971 RepID=UPI0026F1775A|nr:O-antigen polymerase [Selenomonas ruminantium]
MDAFINFIAYTLIIFIIFTTYYSYKKTGTLILSFPLWPIYYWSIYGCLEVVNLKNDDNYHYIELEMMHFYLDENYILALVLYGIFILIFGMLIIEYSQKYSRRIDFNSAVELVNKENKYTLRNACFAIILLCIYYSGYENDISYAKTYGVPIYEVTRQYSSLGSARMAFDFIGDLLLLMCVSNIITYSGARNRAFMIILAIYFYLQLLMGNRSSLLIGGVVCILIYIEQNGIKRMLNRKALFYTVSGFMLISLITFIRLTTVDNIMNVLGNYSMDDIIDILSVGNDSIEKFAAHSSMYFSLRENLDINYGSSIYYLISSFVPGFLEVERPETIYQYYINGIGIVSNKGFTINHITAWFLNFGIVGICVGAYIWAKILIFLYDKYRVKKTYHTYLMAVFFSSYAIQMIRGGGLESYKGGLLLGAVIPAFIIKFLNKKWW